MKEIVEFRIKKEYYNLLSKPNNGIDNGMVYVVKVAIEDPQFQEIKKLTKEIKEKNNESFFLYSNIKRKYNTKELDAALLFNIKIKSTFEPTGEECGTIYDETTACRICGANRTQRSPLTLKQNSIPKKDIARTIAGDIVVSEKFMLAFNQSNLKGALFEPVYFAKIKSDYYQLKAMSELELSENTIAGVNLFDFSKSNEATEYLVAGNLIKTEKEIYKCPLGHTLGLNLLSEPYVFNSPLINNYDLFASKQQIGVKRGLLRPEPIYLCSPAFRKMVINEGLTGLDFEIANIE